LALNQELLAVMGLAHGHFHTADGAFDELVKLATVFQGHGHVHLVGSDVGVDHTGVATLSCRTAWGRSSQRAFTT
jgi:hypothetical protein